jgi:hypothetical protein
MLALFVLTSCAYVPGATTAVWNRIVINKCTTDYSDHLRGVDWDQAKKINVRIRQGDFRPSYIGMYMNQPYVMSIENADDSRHSFRAMEFFRAIALAGLRVDGGDFDDVQCLDGIGIPAKQTAEIRFVAVRDGTYEFDDNSLMISLAMVGSGGGFITIEPPRVIEESPVKHLMLRESTIVKPGDRQSQPTGLFDDQDDEPAPAPGLFDDQEETPSPPTGLFDDQEEEPSEPSTSLFDDEEPEQPIQASPSIPVDAVEGPIEGVEETPDEGLFSDPSLTDEPEIKADEGLFGDPAPDLEPDDNQPETSIVDSAPEVEITPEPPVESEPELPGEGLFDSAPDIVKDAPEVIEEEEEMFVETEPEAPVTAPVQEPAAPVEEPVETEEEELFVEEEIFDEEVPVDGQPPETTPLPTAEDTDDSGESLTAKTELITPEPIPEPQAPAALPEGFERMEGPPADIYSDPPDVVNTGPGSGGDGGEDTFNSSG